MDDEKGWGMKGPPWPREKIDRLCDLIADERSFSQAARIMGVTKNAAIGQFARIRRLYGGQAL